MDVVLDEAQKKLGLKLSELAKNFNSNSKKLSFSFFQKELPLKNFYIYSAPGRGKTMLMRYFFDHVESEQKTYFHFNNFIYQIHKNLHEIRLSKQKFPDELIEALKRVIKDSKLICFDEFQVYDIADAMILGRIFSYFFTQKITVVTTSNTKPQDLYKNGLQREIFLDFIHNILLKNVEVIKLDDDVDYRALFKKNLDKRYFTDAQEFGDVVENFIRKDRLKPRILEVWGREILLKQTCDNIAVTSFDELCKDKFSASDYRVICQEFSLIFLLNLPVMNKDDKNELKRFMLFIDEVYENKVALIILAQDQLEKIYSDAKNDKTFDRAISRLKEIRSDHYYQNSRFGVLP